MTKIKSLAIAAVVFALAVSNAAAQNTDVQISIGAGGLFSNDTGGGFKANANYEYTDLNESYSLNGSYSMKMPYSGGGVFGFLDMTYGELSLSYWGGGGEITSTSKSNGTGESGSSDWSRSNLNIGLLLKYPIALSDKVSIFPLGGIDYMIALSVKHKDGDDMFEGNSKYSAGDLSALWFKAGGGIDYRLSGGLYIRGEVLYGIRLASKYETDLVDALNKQGGFDASYLLGQGFTVKAAIGYIRFNR